MLIMSKSKMRQLLIRKSPKRTIAYLASVSLQLHLDSSQHPPSYEESRNAELVNG